MRTRELTPNLVMLTKFRLVNAFLVREDDGFTLVDTTLGGAADAILAAAAAAGAPIRRIAITHFHNDHIGAVDALKERLGDAVELLWPEREAPAVATRIDAQLAGGDRIGSLEVLDSPGHTHGHISFLDTRDRALIAGDVFTTFGKTAVTSHPNGLLVYPAKATVDPAEDLASARKLRALEPTLLVVGHGRALPHPLASMDAAIARAAERA